MSIKEFLIDYLTKELVPLHRQTLLDEVVRLCRVIPDAPRGKRAEWEAGLNELVESGDVIAAGQRVQIVRKEDRSSTIKQDMLF